MCDAVEEEEFGDVEGLNQHGEAGSYACRQGDYVDDADDVEDDVAWACQGPVEERHRCVEDLKNTLNWETW